ncbi:NERD domain-containing protein [Sporolactobacillus shoreae]|uniref:NERD domain-containing protein n=1 Tax=Sporolactobacillus shoreae TaxID=1465501 RepID=A0A4Z0GST8_9BACL|nr:nuclease-related domain-containing protein [Sporolactobacillus shoreae]TGA99771.1 NERD domain-containing protein [Sporolactobacillus shoreae]
MEIIKQCEIPYHVRQLSELCSRFLGPPEKKEDLQRKLNRYLAGYKGEKSLDYFLSLIPEKEVLALHQIRLKGGAHHFEIDCIILTTRALLILEVKHIAGVLSFHSKINQLVRSIDGEEQRLPDPITQADRLHVQLQVWLTARKLGPIPIEKQVVITSPRSILDTRDSDEKFFKIACLIERVPHRISEILRRHPQKLFTLPQIKSIARKLCKAHEPLIQNVYEVYNVQPEQIHRGVQCSSCGIFGMDRKKGKWVCPECGHSSTKAHLRCLKSYVLLNGSSITNRQCRDFLRLKSDSIARKLLQKMNLPSTGKFKDRIYHLPIE